jgi:hypothetical protein
MSGLQPVQPQNCSLNLNADSQKAREIKAPQHSKLTPAPTIPTLRITRSPHSLLGIVATAREVVQEESSTYSAMTPCVRLFHNTLFPCGDLTHGEVAVSEDAERGGEHPTISRSVSSNFFGYGTGMAEVRLICVGKPIDGERHEKSDEA